MKRTCMAASIVAMLALAWPCAAWGPSGHRIIANIAEKYLSEKSRAAVKELLGEETLADVSTWADEARSDPAYDYLKPLHYVNVPRSATSVDLERDCPNQQCVLGAINHYTKVLKNKNSTRQEKILALKLLVHFVGDVHTPLHVSYEDDRGGNHVKVNYFGDATRNLHGIWDGNLIEHRSRGDREDLEKQLMRRMTDARLKKWRSATNPVEWANESLKITRQIYADLPGRGEVMSIDDAYCKKYAAVIDDRLSAGGVRLAALLNEIFGEDKPVRRPATRPARQAPPPPATQPQATPPIPEPVPTAPE